MIKIIFLDPSNNKWAELLSFIILTPPTSQIGVNFSKMLLHAVAGGKKNYYKIKDNVHFNLEVAKISNLYSSTQEFKKLLNYDQYVTITQSLISLESIAHIRPQNWANYCKTDQKILNILHLIILFNVEECCERGLKLLAIYYNPNLHKNLKESNNIVNQEELMLTYDQDKTGRNDSHWLDITEKYVNKYVDDLLIETHSKKISTAVVDLLIGLWNVGHRDQKLYILNKVTIKLDDIIGYGTNSENVLNLFGYIAKNIDWESNESLVKIRQNLAQKLIKIYDKIHNNIVNHPNHYIYMILQNLLRDQKSTFNMRYFFDTTSCFRCYEGLNIPYNESRLNDVKTEFKYTHNCILAKLNNSLSINSLKIHIDDRHSYKQFKIIKTINVFTNNKGVNDLVELKNNWQSWKRVMSYNIDRKKNKDGIFII